MGVSSKMNVHQASRRINSGQHAANVRVQPPVYGHPVNMGVRQQAMHQVNQWQTHQAWQAQQHHQTQTIQKTFIEGGANRGGAAPPPQQRRAPSQAIPILDAPSSSEEEKAPQPKKSSALLIIDPDTMEEVKVEKVAPKPKQNKGKGGKGGPRLTGLANYEARKMQRQSSIGSRTVSSGPPARGAGAAPLNNDYSSPNHKEGSIEEKELHTSPALEIPPQVPQVPQVPMPAPVQVQHREPSPVSQRQAFLENNNQLSYNESPLNHSYSHTMMQERQEEPMGHEFDQMHLMGQIQAPQMQTPHPQQWDMQPPSQPTYVQPNAILLGKQHESEQQNPQLNEWQQVSDLAETSSIPDDTMSVDSDENKGRSKAQMKNQKKHQRQRERKAKELRNQCMQLVVKWKLSALAAPLIGMGFPEEQCMDAVCACSDGKKAVDLERCVAWLLTEQSKGSAFSFGNSDDAKNEPSRKPDIDITDEVQKMVDAESAMNISGAEVERAVLAHNGDVYSACNALGVVH